MELIFSESIKNDVRSQYAVQTVSFRLLTHYIYTPIAKSTNCITDIHTHRVRIDRVTAEHPAGCCQSDVKDVAVIVSRPASPPKPSRRSSKVRWDAPRSSPAPDCHQRPDPPPPQRSAAAQRPPPSLRPAHWNTAGSSACRATATADCSLVGAAWEPAQDARPDRLWPPPSPLGPPGEGAGGARRRLWQ